MKSLKKFICRILPIKKNKIVFFTGNYKYGCNPKYICEEIIRRQLPYELVWVNDNTNNDIQGPPQVRTVISKKANKEYATCRVMVCNHRMNYFSKFRKKPGQTYIQTWHGSYGIKKCEGDCLDSLPREWIEMAKINSANIDYLLSASSWDTETLARCFFCPPEVIHMTGMPRNDVFFNDLDRLATKVKSFYQLKPDTKIALYAPTFREARNLEPYQLDYNRLVEELTAKFGGNWVVMVRLHPNMEYMFDQLPAGSATLVNATTYPDMQELLCASDLLISDYSSCMFDFALTRRPVLIYATDIDEYNTERGFLYPLEATPFPIATNNDAIAENIRHFDISSYRASVDAFFMEKGSRDDGHAAERIVDYIESLMK